MAKYKGKNNAKPDTTKNILKRLIQVIFSIVITAIILFVSAGRIDWIYAWAYIAASVLVILINSLIFSPELISERGRKKENTEKWDKIVSGLIIIPWLLLYVTAGLDIRFNWSPEFALWPHITGLIIFISGNAFVSWAMISNAYFSTTVRIQYDRGHTVSKGGPYRYIRHPGYLGMIIYHLSSPIILGSLWALIPAVLTAILFIIRTAFEDNTLRNKLEGYQDFAKKVKYRLMPGVW
jgi:protein-S-isoprenylcysteine O-methyltransferase Ste14